MSTFSFPARDLFVTTAVAAETTAATFVASASNGEVAVLKKDGSAAAAAGEEAYVIGKDSKGRIKSSATLKPGQIKSVVNTAPVTVVPAYSSMLIDTTGSAAGDIWEGLVRIQNYGSQSVYDEYLTPFSHAFVTGDTNDTVCQELIKSLSFNFSRVEGGGSTYVNNKTGYTDVSVTQADAFAQSAALAANDVIWIIETGKAYFSIDGNKNASFALTFTEKTDWSVEIAAGTAEYLRGNPWFDFVKLDGATPTLLICSKPQPTTDMKLQGYDIQFKVGLKVLDGTTYDTQSTITVNNVGKASSPGEGKYIRNLEIFAKGHTGDFYRGMGYPNNFDNYYDADKTVNYYVVTVEFQEDVKDVNTLSGHPTQKLLQIACSTSGAATAVYNALVALV